MNLLTSSIFHQLRGRDVGITEHTEIVRVHLCRCVALSVGDASIRLEHTLNTFDAGLHETKPNLATICVETGVG